MQASGRGGRRKMVWYGTFSCMRIAERGRAWLEVHVHLPILCTPSATGCKPHQPEPQKTRMDDGYRVEMWTDRRACKVWWLKWFSLSFHADSTRPTGILPRHHR